MNKKFLWIVVIIASGLLIVAFFIYQDSQRVKAEEKKINEANKNIYGFYSCLVNCDSKIAVDSSGKFTIRLDDECLKNCDQTYLTNISSVNLEDTRLIHKDYDVVSCGAGNAVQISADRYKGCLKRILPTLKERYHIS